jgi:hypothetical protein
VATEDSLHLLAARREIDIADALDDFFGFIRISTLDR